MNQWNVPVVEPPVIKWYKAYCICMAILYLIVAGLGVFLVSGGADMLEPRSGDELPLRLQGSLYLGIGLMLFIPFVVALFLGREPWVWIYGIVLICISMGSCCCLPASIPLLIFWIKPDAKQYFGRTD